MTNDVITMNTLSANETLTMSSREIAELTGKQHKNVMADIRKMLGELDGLKIEPVNYVDAKGEKRPEYRLPKRETLILVSGYSVQLRGRIIDRWQELEEQVSQPINYDDPVHIKGFARHLLWENERKDKVIEQMQPKASYYDAFMDAEGLFGLQNAGRALGCKPKLFIDWLVGKALHRQSGKLVPYQKLVAQGYFVVKQYKLSSGLSTAQTYMTPKGLEYVAAKLPAHLKVKQP